MFGNAYINSTQAKSECLWVPRFELENSLFWQTPPHVFLELIRKRNHAHNVKDDETYKLYRNKVHRAEQMLKKRYYKEQVENLEPKKWWNEVNKMVGRKTEKAPLTSLLHQFDGDCEQLAENVNSFFKSITSNMQPLETINWPVESIQVPDKYLLSVEKVEKALLAINTSKSPGPDNIPSWILRDFAGVLGSPVTAMYNNTILTGTLPDIWISANVVPLPKESPPKSIESDLRPVSLTAILMKELETFIFQWLWEIVGPQMKADQFGNIKRSSTTMALIEMFDNWAKTTDKLQTMVRILMLDYSKAFDLIDHNIVLAKLMSMGVPNVLLRWVYAFLYERKQRVKVGNSLSSWSTLNGGVPQGTKLGPLLFIVMINDLEVSLPMVKYVDDTTVSESLDNKDVVPGNETEINEVARQVLKYSVENNMKLNAKKTKEMRICFSRSHPQVQNIMINGEDIEVVDQAKLLGIWISSDLKWDRQIDDIHSKACRRIHYIITMKRAGFSTTKLVQMFGSLVRPVLEYAAPLWHSGLTKGQSDGIEDVQERVLRIIFPGKGYTDALKESGLAKLAVRRNDHCKKLFIQMGDPAHKLHHLLPASMQNEQGLRSKFKYEPPKCRTMRYKNTFVPYCLFNFQ